MHDNLHQWAKDWGINPVAVHDLMNRLGYGYEPYMPDTVRDDFSEAATTQRMLLAAAAAGIYPWRNNVGSLPDETGRWIRYGLCNDTKKLNENYKSSDFIGPKPVIITQEMVGHKFAQFWCREMKPADWRYTGQGREPAQLRFIELVLSLGGDAAFSVGGI